MSRGHVLGRYMGFLDFLKKKHEQPVTPQTPIAPPPQEGFEDVPLPPKPLQDAAFSGEEALETPPVSQEYPEELDALRGSPQASAPKQAPEAPVAAVPEAPQQSEASKSVLDLPDFTDEDFERVTALRDMMPLKEGPVDIEPPKELDAPKAPRVEVPQKPARRAPEPKPVPRMPEPKPAPRSAPEPAVREEPAPAQALPSLEEAKAETPDEIMPAHPAFRGLQQARFLSADEYFDLNDALKKTRASLRDADSALLDVTSRHEQIDDVLVECAKAVNEVQERCMQLDQALFEEV